MQHDTGGMRQADWRLQEACVRWQRGSAACVQAAQEGDADKADKRRKRKKAEDDDRMFMEEEGDGEYEVLGPS